MEAFFSFLNRAGEVLAAWAGPMLLQSSLLFLLLLLLDSLLRKRIPAGVRYTLWLLFLVKLLLPPTLALPTGVGTLLPDRQETAFLRPQPISVEDPNPGRLSLEPLLAVRLPQGSHLPSTHQSPRPRTVSPAPPRREGPSLAWAGILLLGWAGGVLFLGFFLLSNLRRASRLLRGARPAPPALQKLARACASQVGLRRPFPLLLSGKAPSPFALGLFRPKVILPLKPALEIPSPRLRTVLLHEAIHIKRWDLPVNLLQGVIQVLYFFHPLLWFANRTLRRTREEAVDEFLAL